MLPLDKWGLQITSAAVGGVEGAQCKVLLPVFYEWLPEGSYDNSSQPYPSRSLTPGAPVRRNGTAYHLMGCHINSSTGFCSLHRQKMKLNGGRDCVLEFIQFRYKTDTPLAKFYNLLRVSFDVRTIICSNANANALTFSWGRPLITLWPHEPRTAITAL